MALALWARVSAPGSPSSSPPCQHGFEPLSRWDETISHPPGAARVFPKVRDGDSWAALGPCVSVCLTFLPVGSNPGRPQKTSSENHGLTIHGRAG
jgi:hypothetical protein